MKISFFTHIFVFVGTYSFLSFLFPFGENRAMWGAVLCLAAIGALFCGEKS